MAEIVNKMNDSILLGNNMEERFTGSLESLKNPEEEIILKETMNSVNYRIRLYNRMSVNNQKQYKKGIIGITLACSNCGRKETVQMTYSNYNELLKLHSYIYDKEGRLANETEIGELFSKLNMSIPIIELFSYRLCQRCISNIKCQRSEKDATNVEKNSL